MAVLINLGAFGMKQNTLDLKIFEPEVYCLRCQHMEWNDQKRKCSNYEQPICPLLIKSILADFEVSCLVV